MRSVRGTSLGWAIGLFLAIGGLTVPTVSMAQLSNRPPSEISGAVYRCQKPDGSMEYTNVERTGCVATFQYKVTWKKIASGGSGDGAWELYATVAKPGDHGGMIEWVYATPRTNEMTGQTYAIAREHVTAGCVSGFVLVDQRMLYRDAQAGQPVSSEKVMNKMMATPNTPAEAIVKAFCSSKG